MYSLARRAPATVIARAGANAPVSSERGGAGAQAVYHHDYTLDAGACSGLDRNRSAIQLLQTRRRVNRSPASGSAFSRTVLPACRLPLLGTDGDMRKNESRGNAKLALLLCGNIVFVNAIRFKGISIGNKSTEEANFSLGIPAVSSSVAELQCDGRSSVKIDPWSRVQGQKPKGNRRRKCHLSPPAPLSILPSNLLSTPYPDRGDECQNAACLAMVSTPYAWHALG
ncbi:hypothetical protein DFH06DRAFT_1294135, partial [Mycena polygramma]